MGKKPAERAVKMVEPRVGLGYDPGVLCRCCAAPSRRVRGQWRACANGHSFIKKSDQ